MDISKPQTTPPPGRTRVRIGDRVWEMDDEAWERWVRFGRVPPDALVLSLHWTRGLWRRAASLEVYHIFLPPDRVRGSAKRAAAGTYTVAGMGGRLTGDLVMGGRQPPKDDRGGGLSGGDGPREGDETGGADPVGRLATKPDSGPLPGTLSGLPAAIWGRGVSVTQVLLLLNLMISAGLVLSWKDAYSEELWAFSARLRELLSRGWAPVLFIPLFLHASAQHLLGNMAGLIAGGAAVEEFYGRTRTLLLYLGAGLCGAFLSLLRSKPVLSVGASGCIMGLYAVILVFLLRYRGRFSERQKIKTTRIYIPLLVLALFPSLLMADIYSHLGGFVGGLILAWLIGPDPRRTPWLDAEAHDVEP